jgi:glucuronoarabinoxylan endo-1,4-beta-xylanase
VGNTRFLKVILASALFTWGCSSGTGQGGTGTGGSSSGTGGTSSATGGTSQTGGSTGTGGSSSSTGGTKGTGGVVGTGGSGTGGSATGGSGSGGKAGGSGTGGAAGAGTGGTSSGTGGTSSTGAVTVQTTQTEQTIEGFGLNGALAPSSAAYSSTVLDNLFTTNKGDGLGLSILRVGMDSTGALSGNQGDVDGAKSRGAKIIGSCWSPPSSCKTNGNTQDGGYLCSAAHASDSGNKCSSANNTSCYDSWSTTIANFASSKGFYAMSIGNEPDFASCGNNDPCNGDYDTTLYTANDMVAFVKIAGPKLKAKNVKVIAPEASEWNHAWSNTSAGPDVSGKNSSDPLKCGFPASTTGPCTMGLGYDYGHYMAKDATAWAAFDIFGVHEYDSQTATPWPSDVNGGKPDHEVWETEMSGVKWWNEQGPSCDINNGIAVGGWIHSALTTGNASAWLYWWYQSYYTDDNEGLLLMSGSKASGCTASSPTKRYWVLGNYSKFVRPGYTRVDISGSVPSKVLLSAFTGSDGTVVVVAINQNSTAQMVPITIAGGTAPSMMTPYATNSTDNLKAGTAVAVSDGSFTAMLGATSVTTFVSSK